MNITQAPFRLFSFLAIVCALLALPRNAVADVDPSAVPSIISNGFKSWAAKDASYAFDIWKIGGLLENNNKPGQLSNYFSRMDRTLGKFKSYELIESKRLGGNSQTLYFSINFEHAAIYARYLIYKTDKDWVIQNMDFSPKPEAVMPWLAFTGEDYTQ